MGSATSRFKEAMVRGDRAEAYELFFRRKAVRDGVEWNELLVRDHESTILHLAALHGMRSLYHELLAHGGMPDQRVSPLSFSSSHIFTAFLVPLPGQVLPELPSLDLPGRARERSERGRGSGEGGDAAAYAGGGSQADGRTAHSGGEGLAGQYSAPPCSQQWSGELCAGLSACVCACVRACVMAVCAGRTGASGCRLQLVCDERA